MVRLGAVAVTGVDVGGADDQLVVDRVAVADDEVDLGAGEDTDVRRLEAAVLDVDEDRDGARTERLRGRRIAVVEEVAGDDRRHGDGESGEDGEQVPHDATLRITSTRAATPATLPRAIGHQGRSLGAGRTGTTEAGATPASVIDGSPAGSWETARS